MNCIPRDGKGSGPKTLITALVVTILIITAGCLGHGSFGTATTNEGTSSHANLTDFNILQVECATAAEIGDGVTVFQTERSDRVVVEHVVNTGSPSATLNATISPKSNNASMWVLNVTSHVDETKNDSCEGRVKYSATIDISKKTTYTIVIHHDGERVGTITQRKGASGVGGESGGSDRDSETTSAD